MLLPDMNALANVIYREIREAGPMPFVRFMELALYCPELGFYERFPHRIGRKGDFITSVSVGSMFGRLLAFRFSRWLDELGTPGGRRHLVEAGAHDGRLALDILTWFAEHAPSTLDALDYLILEPSERRQSWQRTTLANFGSHVRWIRDWSALAFGSLHGVIFSNELMDAFPVHRLGWDARNRRWFEYGVTLSEDGLTWCRLPLTVGAEVPPMTVPDAIQSCLSDGFVLESMPEASRWWRQAAAALGRGHLISFDYGRETVSSLDPSRPEGTLRAYRGHHLASDLLADPGEQDLTAHVDFRALKEAGEASGLRTCGLMSQGRFLVDAMEEVVQLQAPGFGWTRKERSQFQTLTHPEHLGERFKVLVQVRLDAGGAVATAD